MPSVLRTVPAMTLVVLVTVAVLAAAVRSARQRAAAARENEALLARARRSWADAVLDLAAELRGAGRTDAANGLITAANRVRSHTTLDAASAHVDAALDVACIDTISGGLADDARFAGPCVHVVTHQAAVRSLSRHVPRVAPAAA